MLFSGDGGSNRFDNGYLMDVLNIAAFIVGMANYGENLSQSAAQELIDNQTKDIHNHLREQDEKINKILEMLGGK